MSPASEPVTITFTRYMTPDGRPTCARNWVDGQVCEFLRTKSFGTSEVCGLLPTQDRVHRDDGGSGYLKPAQNCPLWRTP